MRRPEEWSNRLPWRATQRLYIWDRGPVSRSKVRQRYDAASDNGYSSPLTCLMYRVKLYRVICLHVVYVTPFLWAWAKLERFAKDKTRTGSRRAEAR